MKIEDFRINQKIYIIPINLAEHIGKDFSHVIYKRNIIAINKSMGLGDDKNYVKVDAIDSPKFIQQYYGDPFQSKTHMICTSENEAKKIIKAQWKAIKELVDKWNL
jgi:hypothetical protein